jgi:NifU-like protein involved in Fe-S cluster formation
VTSARLYTPELLGLATRLAEWPLLPDTDGTGEARSPTCGSSVVVDLKLDASGRIAAVGLRAHACAVGQASAALFAENALGRDHREIETALAELSNWLSSDAALPEWPGLAAIAGARAFPARHGAILLPWTAALAALSTAPVPR